MKASELIKILQKYPNAEVQFFDYQADKFLAISMAERGKLRGEEIVTLGERNMKDKLALSKILKDKPKDGVAGLLADILKGGDR